MSARRTELVVGHTGFTPNPQLYQPVGTGGFWRRRNLPQPPRPATETRTTQDEAPLPPLDRGPGYSHCTCPHELETPTDHVSSCPLHKSLLTMEEWMALHRPGPQPPLDRGPGYWVID